MTALASGGFGGLWVGTTAGLAHFDGQEFDALRGALAEKAGHEEIGALWRDPASGALWVGLRQGGVVVTDGQNVWAPPGAETLRLGPITAVRPDAEGNIWLGTQGGVWRFRQAWETVVPNGIARAPDNAAIAIVEGDDGGIWFALDKYAARRAPDGSWTTLDTGGTRVEALIVDGQGRLWVSSDRGFRRSTPAGWEVVDLPDSVTRVLALARAGGDAVWAGTDQGLWRWQADGTWQRATATPPLDVAYSVYAILPEADGGAWIGTSAGAFQVSPGGEVTRRYTVDDGLHDLAVLALRRDAGGQLWAGTLTGVSRLRSASSRPAFERLDVLKPIEGRQVDAIAEDHQGRTWFGTDDGVYVYDGQSLIHYTTTDGLASNQVKGLFRDRGGQLWLATDGGIQRYPAKRAFPWGNVATVFAGDETKKPENGAIHLGWDQADFIAQLDGGDLSTPFEELAFSYQVEGLGPVSRCVSLASTNREIACQLRPGGHYKFLVHTQDKDGNVSQTAETAIVIAPVPLIQTTWVKILSGVLLPCAVLASLAIRLRLKRRGEYVYNEEIAVTLRQDVPGSTSHLVSAEIKLLGLWNRRQPLGRRFVALLPRRLMLFVDPAKPAPVCQLRRPPRLLTEVAALRDELEENPDGGQAFDLDRLRTLGRLLLEAALPPNVIDELRAARRAGQRARLRLIFDGAASAELAGLPWEYMYHEELGFLAQHEETTVVRSLPAPLVSPARLPKCMRILVVIACPNNLPGLRTAGEQRRIETAFGELLDEAKGTPAVRLGFLVGQHAAQGQVLLGEMIAKREMNADLETRLSTGEPVNIVHFIGHAGPESGRRRRGGALCRGRRWPAQVPGRQATVADA